MRVYQLLRLGGELAWLVAGLTSKNEMRAVADGRECGLSDAAVLLNGL